MQLTMFKPSHTHTYQNKHKLVAKNNNHNKQNKKNKSSVRFSND